MQSPCLYKWKAEKHLTTEEAKTRKLLKQEETLQALKMEERGQEPRSARNVALKVGKGKNKQKKPFSPRLFGRGVP